MHLQCVTTNTDPAIACACLLLPRASFQTLECNALKDLFVILQLNAYLPGVPFSWRKGILRV